MNNLHISLTDFQNESRMIKETNTIVSEGLAENVFIAALHTEGLKEDEVVQQNIFVHRFSLISRKLSRGLISQLLKYVEFVLRVVWFYRNKNIGMVNVHALGLLPLGVLFKLIFRSKLIYDTHELETEVDGLAGIRKKLSKIVEKFFIKYTDLVLVVGEGIADHYQQSYDIERPTVVLNAPRFRHQQRSDLLRQSLKIPQEKKIFLYQGSLSEGRGVELLVEAFENWQMDQVAMVFMGYGPLEDFVKEATRKSPNIYFHPAVSPHEVLKYTASADMGFSLIENTCLSYFLCMPNKLFEYAMVGIPVVVSNMKEMARFVNDHKIGFVVEDLTKEGVRTTVTKILSGEQDDLRSNALSAAKSNSWEVQELKMVDAYRKVLNLSYLKKEITT